MVRHNPNATNSHPQGGNVNTNVFTFSPQFQSEMEDAPPDEIETMGISESSTAEFDEDGEEDDHVFLENRRLVFEADGEERQQALLYFRRLVSGEIEHSIPRVLRAGLVPILVDYLQKDAEPALQLEAAWTLTNISGGDSKAVQQVVAAGAIPIFVRLLAKDNADLVDQVIWALGNLAGDSPIVRDTILAEGVVPLLVPIAHRSWEFNLVGLQTYAWVLTNFCGREPLPDLECVEPLIPVLTYLLSINRDDQIVKDVCLSLIYLVNQEPPMTDAILQTGIATQLVLLLSRSSIEQTQAGLRLIGEILSGTEEQTQHMIDAGVIPALGHLATMNLPRKHQNIRREAYWALSNITAGTEAQANAVMEALAAKLPLIIRAITDSDDALLRREALTVFTNTFSAASWHHVNDLMDAFQFVRILCEVLRLCEMETVTVALEAIYRLLGRAQQEGHFDRFAEALGEHGGFLALEHLQFHAAVEVYEGSALILRDYFSDEEGAADDGDEDEGEENEEVES